MAESHRQQNRAGGRQGSPPAVERSDDALSLFRRGRLAEAERLSRRALVRDPEDPSALNVLAMVEARRGRHHRAIPLFRRVLCLCPDYGDAYRNLGLCLMTTGAFPEARDCFSRAIELNASDVDSLNNLANVFLAEGDIHQSIELFRRAVALAPDNPAFAYNLGNTLRLLKDYAASLASYEQTLELLPDFLPAICRAVYVQLQLCQWQRLQERRQTADRLMSVLAAKGVPPDEEPHAHISRCDDPRLNRIVAEAASRRIAAGAAASARSSRHSTALSSDDRIAIGYVSGSFRNHPTVFLLAGVLKNHDRQRFRVHLYSATRDDGSCWRAWLQSHCHRFVDILHMDPAQAARTIAADGIDILVDLDGHSAGNRLNVAALRPAPVAVSYLGYPGTTGASFIDYLIADRVVIPEEDARHYSENIVVMPHQYLPTDGTPELGHQDVDRRSFGLDQDATVFCSFNQAYKIEPTMFDCWMRVLQRVPGSVLWLWRSNPWMAHGLRREAARRGVDPDRRLVFADLMPRPAHLARLGLADIGLDTRIYNGHTTTQDALSVGVPVITLQGRHFASRVSSSLLTAVGLGELVVHSLDAYEELAVTLGSDRRRIMAAKTELAANRLKHPLFDARRYVRNLESAFARMIERHRAGRRPAPFAVIDRGADGADIPAPP